MARTKQDFNVLRDLRFKDVSKVEYQGAGTPGLSKEYMSISSEHIVPSPFNEGLSMEKVEAYADSMKEVGMLEPIVVYDMSDGTYQILTGHQRFYAWCKILGHKDIRCVVLPYEKDPVRRFIAHTEANTLSRNKDLPFWLSRIDHAKAVLKETGFNGSREEELQKLSEMLNGISRMQLYRYESFRKLIPALQQFETNGWLSAMTLYAAVSLDAEQQEEVARRVLAYKASQEAHMEKMNASFEITRDEFKTIVNAVKKGASTELTVRKKHSYADRISKASMSFLRTLSGARADNERTEAIRAIENMRAELDRIEESLK